MNVCFLSAKINQVQQHLDLDAARSRIQVVRYRSGQAVPEEFVGMTLALPAPAGSDPSPSARAVP